MNRFTSEISFFIKKIREKGFFHLLSANILIQFFAFLSQLFVANILSPEDIGRIKVIQTYLSIFSIIAGMGFGSSTLKICSEERDRNENYLYFNAALIFSIISTSIVYIIILILNSFSIFSSDELITLLIPIGLFPVISSNIFLLYTSYFQAIKEIKLFSNLTVLNKVISIIAIILFSSYWGIKGYYIAYNISFICLIILAIVVSRKQINYRFNFNLKKIFHEHWNYAKISVLSYIISETSGYIDIIFISIFISDMKEIGYYGFALTITTVLRIFPSTVQQITIPYFSSFKDSKDSFLKIFKRYNYLLYIVVFVSFILLIIFAHPIIHFLFKGKYDPSVSYLIILSLGWSLRNVNLLQGGAIFGFGKVKYNALISFSSLLAAILIYPPVILFFGVRGAAYASIFNGLVMWLTSRYFFKKAINEIT